MQVENISEEAFEEMEEEDEYSKEISLYVMKLKEDPYNYNAYIRLIDIYKNSGEFDELREIRDKMSENFPLREDLWLDWIKDEIRMNNLASPNSDNNDENMNMENETGCAIVLKLFEKAVKDYLSIEIWLEYVQFCIGQMHTIGLETVRDIFEQALVSCGLHVTKGAILWEAYREFENAILSTYEAQFQLLNQQFQETHSNLQGNDGEAELALAPIASQIEVQRQAVLSLFKRQLTVPLLGMEATQKEFTAWWQASPYGNNNAKPAYNYESILSAYSLAQGKLAEILPFEDAIHTARLRLLESKSDGKRIEDQMNKDKNETVTGESPNSDSNYKTCSPLKRGSMDNYRERKELRATLLKHYRTYLSHEINACCGVPKKKASLPKPETSHQLSTIANGGLATEISAPSNTSACSSINTPSRVVCLFERALQDHNTLDADIWLWYARDFTEFQLRDTTQARTLYARGLRNCCLGTTQPMPSAAVDLWIGLARLAEQSQHQGKVGVPFGPDLLQETTDSALNLLLGTSTLGASLSPTPDLYFKFALTFCGARRGGAKDMNGHLSRKEQEKLAIHAKNATKLWMAYLEYLRRQLFQSDNDENIMLKLREAFASASDYLTQSYGTEVLGDPERSITIFWARSEAFIFKDMTKCRELWNQIVKDIGSSSYAWLEWYWVERVQGESIECRKILQRALNATTDMPELIVNECASFERDFGCDTESWEKCRRKWLDIQKRNHERHLKVAECQKFVDEERNKGSRKGSGGRRSKTSPHDGNKRRDDKYHDGKRAHNRHKQQDSHLTSPRHEEQGTGHGDRRGDKRRAEEQGLESKRQNHGDQSLPDAGKSPKDSDGFAIPKVPQSGSKAKKSPQASSHHPIVPAGEEVDNGFHRYRSKNAKPESGLNEPTEPFPSEASFIPSLATVAGQGEKDEELHHSTKNQDALEPSLDYSQLSDRTIFLSNLSFKITSSDISNFFQQFGGIENVHVVKTRKGKTKGFAYLVYKDSLAIAKALKADRSLLLERPVFISPYGKRINNPQNFKYNTGLEKNKLFVRNLPYTTTEDQLLQLFAEMIGDEQKTIKEHLKGVRLVYDNNGRSKGCAYVEFDSDEIAQTVLKHCNEESKPITLEGRTLFIALSDPPGPANKSHGPIASKHGKNFNAPRKRLDVTTTANSLLPRQLRSLKFENDKAL